jgi:hypothetical protein
MGLARTPPREAATGWRRRLAAVDWQAAAESLAERGFARLGPILPPGECAALRRLWTREEAFRSRIAMERHRYGRGEYRYFAAPLPAPVQTLREALYTPLAAIANGWQEALGAPERFPADLAAFLALCHRAGQARPTPLLLRYEAGGYNRLHQDRYGSVAFPLQGTVLLSRPGADFEGGELVLVEQRPRMQSRATAIALGQGEAIVFPNADRPVAGARGTLRASTRHGVSEVRRGLRMTLGLIFHDAA